VVAVAAAASLPLEWLLLLLLPPLYDDDDDDDTSGLSTQNHVEKEKPLVAGHFLKPGRRRPESLPWKKK